MASLAATKDVWSLDPATVRPDSAAQVLSAALPGPVAGIGDPGSAAALAENAIQPPTAATATPRRRVIVLADRALQSLLVIHPPP
jgi:hypothetical protein